MSTITAREAAPCPTCGRPLRAGGACLHCAMAGALGALEEACSDPEKADSLSPETRGGLPRPRRGFATFAPPELPGRFAHFEVRREVASGGMGTVYEAEDTRLGRTVALKMIRAFAFSTAEEKARFTAEAGAAAALDHPNIVPIYEIGDVGGQPFFTMKLIEGSTLAGRLRDGAMPVREAAALLAKIARAVQHAHSRGVLHRDLKPGNIMLDASGEPFLTDFGLAKLADHDSGFTVSHAQLGTPQYMSPEQAAGRTRDISTASDVWALGVMLCQILSGRLPFEGESRGEIWQKIGAEEPSFPGPNGRNGAKGLSRVPTVPSDLGTLVARCLEKEPARRMASAGLLADELECWLAGRPIRSRRVTAGERVWKWMRRHPYRVAAVTALAVSLLGGSVTSLVLWRRAEHARAAAVHTADHERRTAYAASLAAAAAARERADFGTARRLLEDVVPELRGFDWRLMRGLCRGGEKARRDFGVADAPQTLALQPVEGGVRLAVVTAKGGLHFLNEADATPAAPPRDLPAWPESAAAGPFRGLAFSPDGVRFSLARGDVLRVFETASLALLAEETLWQPDAAWLGADRLLVGSWRETTREPATALVLDFSSLPPRKTPLPAGLGAPVAVSRDGKWAALSRIEYTRPCTAEIWPSDALGSGASPRKTLVVCAPPRRPRHLALSDDGALLAASSDTLNTSGVEIFDTATGALRLAQAMKLPATSLDFAPGQPAVSVSGADSVARVFSVPDDARGTIPLGVSALRGVYDDGGAHATRQPLPLSGETPPPARVLTRSANGGAIQFLLGHHERVSAACFLREPRRVATAGADGTVRFWPLPQERPGVRIYPIRTGYDALVPTATPDGELLLYKKADDFLYVWDAGREVRLHGPGTPVAILPGRRLVFMADRRAVACEFPPGATALGRELWTSAEQFPDYESPWTRRAVLSRDGRTIAGAFGFHVFVLDGETGALTFTPLLPYRAGTILPYSGLDLSPDGRWIVATGFGPRALLFEAADLGRPPISLGESSSGDTAVAFHPSEPLLLLGDVDGRVRVFETGTWKLRPDLGWPAHAGPVTALAISTDGALVATSGDTTLELAPALPEPGVAGRRARLAFPITQPANWIHFAGDAALLHSEPAGVLEVWRASGRDEKD